MPDLNELLRWSIANTPAPAAEPASNLSLQFRPTTQPHAANSALHPSDPLYQSSHSATSTDDFTTTEPSSLPVVPPRRSDLTTEMLDHIMGKSDSVIMKEKMAFALDESHPEDARVEALDDFEMLVEMIDNANNMPVLKLWDPILMLLKSPSPKIVTQALWIIGTAVQNNLKAQAALYIFNALPPILNHIYPPGPAQVRAKATYALSSALKHWPLASSALLSNSSQGYKTLQKGVTDTDLVVRRKMAFLVGTLIMQSGEKYEGDIPSEVKNLVEGSEQGEDLIEGLKREGVISALIQGLIQGGDLEYEENAIRALSKAGLGEEKSSVRGVWDRWGSSGQAERGLDGEDGQEITRSMA